MQIIVRLDCLYALIMKYKLLWVECWSCRTGYLYTYTLSFLHETARAPEALSGISSTTVGVQVRDFFSTGHRKYLGVFVYHSWPSYNLSFAGRLPQNYSGEARLVTNTPFTLAFFTVPARFGSVSPCSVNADRTEPNRADLAHLNLPCQHGSVRLCSVNASQTVRGLAHAL